MKMDTIAAISTSMTSAGIGIVRVSGEGAVSAVDSIFKMKNGKKLSDAKSHTLHYGHIYDGDQMVDEVMVALMRSPRSYTREDVVEIDCHGGSYVLKKILETVIAQGVRPAEPGEFTKRAFLNGRIDLSQAESVMDIIQAKNDFALKSSLQQLSGSMSRVIRELRKKILHEIAYIESALDDPEHINLDGYPLILKEILQNAENQIGYLLKNSDNGRILKEGISTVIVGKPNVGKSSLLNMLLEEDRAIVTDIAGTTRDILEEQLNLDGILLNIIDTAGIRDTADVVEQIGVEKAKSYLKDADLIFYVIDTSICLDENDLNIMESLYEKRTIILLNKSDLESKITSDDVLKYLREAGLKDEFYKMVSISAKDGSGITQLTEQIREMFFSGEIKWNDEIYITNVRHKVLLSDAQSSLRLVLESIEQGMPEDFYSIDLMNAYESLGSVIGESVEDDLVNEIFSKFCMGK